MTAILANFQSHTFTRDGITATATPLEFRILAPLLAAHGPLTWLELVDGLYGDRRDGGPDYADDVVRTLISHMRYGYLASGVKRRRYMPILPLLGLEIKATALGYRIVIMDMPQMREAA